MLEGRRREEEKDYAECIPESRKARVCFQSVRIPERNMLILHLLSLDAVGARMRLSDVSMTVLMKATGKGISEELQQA